LVTSLAGTRIQRKGVRRTASRSVATPITVRPQQFLPAYFEIDEYIVD
jgi:hypothetical protein